MSDLSKGARLADGLQDLAALHGLCYQAHLRVQQCIRQAVQHLADTGLPLSGPRHTRGCSKDAT